MRTLSAKGMIFVMVALSLSSAFVSRASAAPPQDPPIEWGSIPKGDLAMNTYPPDENAPAVILCDYGETSFDNDLHLVFKRHTRIKLLSAAAFDLWGTAAVSAYSRDHAEEVSDIEGATYTLAPDGQVRKTELDDKSVFKETYDRDYVRYRFTLPALQKGSVIEYRYTITAKSVYNIQDWVFQKTIPVLLSEYRVTTPRRIAYVWVSRGYLKIQNSETESQQVFSGEAQAFLGERFAPTVQYRFVVKDAPALPDEPFVTTLDDYAARLDMRLYQYASAYTGVVTVSKTWDVVRKELLEDGDFGGRADLPGSVRDIALACAAGRSTPDEKIGSIYNYVRAHMVWTGFQGIYSFSSPDDVLHAGKGSVPEIAFLLLGMLRSAGIQADPVILSTRSHGELETQFPMLHQFNYVLVRVQGGNGPYLLDATDPGRPMDVLPTAVLNVKGLVVNSGPDEWVTLTPPKPDFRKSQADITVREGGEIAGTVEETYDAYSALERRRELRDKTPGELAKQLFDADRSGLVLDSVAVTGKDITSAPLVVRAKFTSGSYAQSAGDFIYVNPALVDRMYATPFKSEKRSYPVSMLYGSRTTSNVSIAVPEGYEVREYPSNMVATIGREDATFLRKVDVQPNSVKVRTDLIVNRTDYPTEMYPQIRAFYDRVMSLQSEKLVLQKKAAAPPKREAKPAGKSKR